VVSFRLDVEGIGDADGDATRYTRLMAFYTPDTVGQVRAALDALQALGRPPRFVAVGLCSGAYWAFHAALEDERVVAAQLVNPRALYWDEGLEARREARRLRLLSRGTTWRRLGRGEVGPARVGRFVTGTAHLARQLPARIREGRGTLARIDAAFDRLADARKPVLFVFGAGEPLRDELERARRLPPQERWPNLDLELVDGRDHTLRPLSMQRQVHEILDRALERTL
jgi:hypothetical protein